MRAFDIYDASKRKRKACARLTYDERTGEMRIAIAPWASSGDLPLMLGLFVERGEREVPDRWARKWVEERVPPQGRQNLGEILRANRLDAYDEVALLAAACGRSSQDDFLLREVPRPTFDYALVKFGDGEGAEGAIDDAPAASAARSWCEVIGPEIARKRKAAGMTQRDLSEKTGIDQAAISRIESGRANPTIDTLDALVKGVGFSLLVKIV